MMTSKRLHLGGALLVLAFFVNQSFGATPQPSLETREMQAGVLLANTESLLEIIRMNGKRQAADAAYQLSLAAAGRRDLDAAYSLIQEATQLAPQQAAYQQAAVSFAYSLEHFDSAIEHSRLQLALTREEVGAGAPAVANVLENLGLIHMSAGHYDDAQDAFEQSLAIRRQSYGDNHIEVVIGYNRLASLARKQHREEAAEQHLQQALAILENIYGDASPNVALGYQNIAEFYLLEHRFVEAEAAYLKALGIVQAIPPKQSVNLRAASLLGLGRLYLAQDRLDDAQTRFEQMDELARAEFGEQHPYVAQARQGLVQVEHARAQAEVSQNIYRALTTEFAKQAGLSPRANGPDSMAQTRP
jgi:tetratricopeptide (TPR) repeat protein